LIEYTSLLKRVRAVLLEGRRQIEEAKVQTYWNTGKLIQDHLLQSKDRSEIYGTRLIKKLARDLEISDRVLYQTLQFYQAFPKIVNARSLSFSRLTWTHYRSLARVSDEKTRLELADRAQKGNWTSGLLEEKIKLEGPARKDEPAKNKNDKKNIPAANLIPKLGTLYAYRLVKHESVHTGKPELKIDLGFNNKISLPAMTKGLKEDHIVESLKDEKDHYSVKPSKLLASKLFTYRAFIERVVDGDTLLVNIDQGFGVESRHYLRLRGIDCAELVETEGKKAKAFVEKILEKVEYVILTSTRSDKYGRYLADVFVPQKSNVILNEMKDPVHKGELLFLNQRLLDEALAQKV